MAKKAKKQTRRPNISPLSVLRPRLDTLFTQPAETAEDATAIATALTALMADIPPDQFLPILVKAVNNASTAMQLTVDSLLPTWLQAHELVEPFTLLVQHESFAEQEYETAVAWLSDAGVEPATLRIEQGPAFYRAFMGRDNMDSQGVFLFFWYSNRQQSRVRGINVLVDYNPPWEGSAKEIISLPQRAPGDAIRDFVDKWRMGEMALAIEEIDAVGAKQQFIELLIANRENEIRLDRDFSVARGVLEQHLFALPDGPDTPLMTIEDFDELCEVGEPTEKIRLYEQRVGRRVRMEDGTEILVGAEGLLDDDNFFRHLN